MVNRGASKVTGRPRGGRGGSRGGRGRRERSPDSSDEIQSSTKKGRTDEDVIINDDDDGRPRGGRGGSRGGRGGSRGGIGGSRGGRGGSRSGRGVNISLEDSRRERSPESSDEIQSTIKKRRTDEAVIINDDDDDDLIEILNESKLNIQIASGTLDLDSDYKKDSRKNSDNVSLDDFELPDNNETADLKNVKSNERKRQKENISRELSDDNLSNFTEISEKIAKSYADNFNKNNKELFYEREMKKLEEQIKEQNEQLKQLRTQFGFSNQFNYPFQPQYNQFQYPFQPQYNQFQYPLQQINNKPSFQQLNVQPVQPVQQPVLQVNVQQPIQQVNVHNNTDESYSSLEKKIRVASESACSDKNFAVKLLQIFFTNDELCVPNLNVYGKNMRGNNEQKVALDDVRVESIKERVMNRVNGDIKFKKMVWDQCVSAMNKKIKEIKDKNN